jgi:hypothetical protein
MKKILLLHGFFASGNCPLAVTLKEVFDGMIEVIAPDLPLHPNEILPPLQGWPLSLCAYSFRQ